MARGRTRCRSLDNLARTTPLTICFCVSPKQGMISGDRRLAMTLFVVGVASSMPNVASRLLVPTAAAAGCVTVMVVL